MATVGERNNNPGCIRPKSGNGYANYSSLEEGYLALNDLLYRKYNNKTAYEIFKIYAPDSDGNDSHAYSEFVVEQLQKQGIQVDSLTKLDLHNPFILQELTKAISKMENGKILGGNEMAEYCSQKFCASKGLISANGLDFASKYPGASNSLTLGGSTSPYIQAMQEGAGLSGMTGNSNITGSSLNMNDIQQQQMQQQQNNAEQEQKENKTEGKDVVGLIVSLGVGMLVKNAAGAELASNAISTLMTSANPVTANATGSTNFSGLDSKTTSK